MEAAITVAVKTATDLTRGSHMSVVAAENNTEVEVVKMAVASGIVVNSRVAKVASATISKLLNASSLR